MKTTKCDNGGSLERMVPLHGSVAFVVATRKLQELLRRRDIYEDDKLLEAFQIGREYEQSVQGNAKLSDGEDKPNE